MTGRKTCEKAVGWPWDVETGSPPRHRRHPGQVPAQAGPAARPTRPWSVVGPRLLPSLQNRDALPQWFQPFLDGGRAALATRPGSLRAGSRICGTRQV